MKATFTGAGPTNSQSFAPSDPTSHWQSQNWELYVSGTMGASGSLQLQTSPDPPVIADASSRWFNQGTAVTAVGTPVWFQARFRKIRFAFTGGDGTTNLIVELV